MENSRDKEEKSYLTELLSREEMEFLRKNRDFLHKFKVTEYFSSIAGREKTDPLRRQFVPDERELVTLPYENPDPLCEADNKAGKRIIQRYPDRVLFLVTSRCAMYCRHCFRRYHAGKDTGDAEDKDIKELSCLISENKNIKEVLLSGGDPLMLSNSRLAYIINAVRKAGKDIVIRIGTRIPVVLPSRIDRELLSILSENLPVCIFTQYNHYREVTEESRGAVQKIIRHGIPVYNQTVLLKGINDDETVLEKLFHDLVSSGVKPYYLFQGDLASGTSHFRTPLKRGLEIMENLSVKMSGLSLPLYAVDLPGGGGKVRLFSGSILSEDNGFFRIKSCDGKDFFYPDES